MIFKEFESNDTIIHIGCFEDDGHMLAFCCLVKHDEYWMMSNTWCENTIRGKKSFAIGIDWVLNKYTVGFSEEGLNHTNKVRRLCNDKNI